MTLERRSGGNAEGCDWSPTRLTSSPIHSSGSVRVSGSSWWSMSMKVSAIRNQVSTIAASAGQPKPNFQATSGA